MFLFFKHALKAFFSTLKQKGKRLETLAREK
jgi:hypothetical protein